MDEIRAALGLVQLEKLPDANRLRREKVIHYRKALLSQEEILVPWRHEPPHSVSSYHIFPVLLPRQADRFQVMERLRGEGVQTSLHYPAYGQFSTYQGQFKPLPVADEIASRVLTLPLYPGLTEEMVVQVCDQLSRAVY
jgi:dTDP-4-amino-4,6-dideoxygalactose transaminase